MNETTQDIQKRMKHFGFFSIGSIIYALFYTFCLYKNASGITYPFFIGGTLFYFFLSLKKLELSAKKDSIFYIVSIMLLGISTFCTDDISLIFMNKMGIFVLSFVLMIHNFHADDTWDFSKYVMTIFQTVFGSISAIRSPISDFSLYLKSRKDDNNNNSKGKYIFMGIMLSIPLIFVVLILLCSADIVFASMLDKLTFNISIPENFIGICSMLLFAFLASYCIITYLERRNIKEEMPDKRTGEPLLAISFTLLLSVIYLFFCGVQIVYLFAGNLELPYGYSYAEYAREGFFQLLFVCMINLTLVLICLGRFKENKLLKGILTIISLCTYIMIASSAMRMIIYIQFYYLTFLRIFVLWSLLVIFLLITGVLITIYKESFPLFKYCMLVVTVLYIGLSYSHPDYHIARYNTSYMIANQETAAPSANGSFYSDVYYLSDLSADAAPVLLSEEISDYYRLSHADYNTESNWLLTYTNRIDEKTKDANIRNFNISRFIASRYLPK